MPNASPHGDSGDCSGVLGVWDGHQYLVLRRSEQLLPIYRSVFSADVRRLVLGATLDSLWANYQGVTLGKGRLWFQIATNGAPRIASVSAGAVPDTAPKPPARKPHNE
jgi:hypothetical protein